MGLDGSTCSESLPEGTCHFEPPEHVPRTSARAQTCVRGPGGLPACHGAESARKDPRPEEKKMPKGQKKHNIYVYIIYKVPLREVATGVAQERNEEHPAWNEYHYTPEIE